MTGLDAPSVFLKPMTVIVFVSHDSVDGICIMNSAVFRLCSYSVLGNRLLK